MCQVGQAPPKILFSIKPDLGGPDALGAQFLEHVHLGQQRVFLWILVMQASHLCSKHRGLLLEILRGVLAVLGEALVALMQGHHCNYDPPVLIIPSIQIFQQLHKPGHHLPHCGCLGLQKGRFVLVSGGGQALESVTLHPLLLVEVKEQIPECHCPDLDGPAKICVSWWIHQKTENAGTKSSSHPLVCTVEPIHFQTDLVKKGELPDGGHASPPAKEPCINP